ncbi:MAG: endonuclease MutS2 [Phycisphaerae bacterium]
MDSLTLDKLEFDAVRHLLSEFCATTPGRSLAARITPSRNPKVVQKWLSQVTEMRYVLRDIGTPPLAGIADISEPLRRAHPSRGADPEDFAQIANALEGCGNVRSFLNALPEQHELLRTIAESLSSFDGEIKAIRSVVTAEATVRDTASSKLQNTRREIETVTRRIHDIMYGFLQNPHVSKYLQSTNVTIHGDRYVLPVRADNRGRIPGVVHRESNTGQTVFVEPNASVELNNKLAKLHEDERREIRRLMNELAIRVQKRQEEIVKSLRICAQVDLICAKAQYAYQFEMTCPELHERGSVELRQARHPLLVDQAYRQEKKGLPPEKRHPVVPIDIRLGSDFDILLITGSNTGGKTVSMKTLGLMAVMTQSGMHIPAERDAKMPVFRDIYIDVGDEQSLEQSLSTFGGHIQRIRTILAKADGASLVLLDELGAGTDPDEGGAIGQAVLDELLEIGCLAMVTTHLSVLKAYAFTHERADNASVEFDTKTLSPTYHLNIGTPGESHAITVAKRLGMPKTITNSARSYMDRQGKQFKKAIKATSHARQTAEKARAQAQQAAAQAKSQQETYEAELADLHRLQDEFAHWLATLPDLQPGHEVYVPSIRKKGKLVRMQFSKQIAVVDVDAMQVEVPIQELMPDLGQNKIREEINDLRRQILQQARESEKARAEAQRIQAEYHRSLKHQKDRARQWDNWLECIANAEVGKVVPIARKPGSGILEQLDLPKLRATIRTGEGKSIELPVQDLFPQTGPFAKGRKGAKRGKGKGNGKSKDRPIRHGKSTGKAAKQKVQQMLDLEPGQQVFVIPFNKRATLIRVDEHKQQATVQSGAFEMQLPLTDLAPADHNPGKKSRK